MRLKVHYFLRVALSSSLLLNLATQWPLEANNSFKKPDSSKIETKFFSDSRSEISKNLEDSLNKKNVQSLTNSLSEKAKIKLENRYKEFIEDFPNASWTIKGGKLLKDNKRLLKVLPY